MKITKKQIKKLIHESIKNEIVNEAKAWKPEDLLQRLRDRNPKSVKIKAGVFDPGIYIRLNMHNYDSPEGGDTKTMIQWSSNPKLGWRGTDVDEFVFKGTVTGKTQRYPIDDDHKELIRGLRTLEAKQSKEQEAEAMAWAEKSLEKSSKKKKASTTAAASAADVKPDSDQKDDGGDAKATKSADGPTLWAAAHEKATDRSIRYSRVKGFPIQVKNTGPEVKKIQKALGFTGRDVDGDFGPKTLDELWSQKKAVEVSKEMYSDMTGANEGIKITESMLRKIIREELQVSMNEGTSVESLKKLHSYVVQQGMKISLANILSVANEIGDELIDKIIKGDMEGAAKMFMSRYKYQ